MQIAGADLEAGILLATPTIEHYNFFYGRRGAGVPPPPPPPAHDALMKQTSGVGRGPWRWWPTYLHMQTYAGSCLQYKVQTPIVQSPGFVVTLQNLNYN